MCSDAFWTFGAKLRIPEEDFASMGSAEAAGDGGGDVLLLGSIGGYQRTSGGFVSVCGCLGGLVEAWRRGLVVG